LRNHDLCYIWFSGVHAFWALVAARILTKKIVIVAGGYDAVYMPEIGYGLKYENKGWRRAYFAFRHADQVLAVSESILKSMAVVGKADNVRTVYHGFDSHHFVPAGVKRDIVITVGHIKWSNVKRKGFEFYVRAAAKMPIVKFVIVGRYYDDSIDYLKSIATPNVEFTGYLSDNELHHLMQQARVYCQLSAHEGFGCALAEAMLSECIPVVTDRGSLPEVAGPDAFYVDYGDVEGTAQAIRNALTAESGRKYRERIMELFPLEAREKRLCELMESL
jgi:glycosyltransferase involved in cell wall biosynthesis